MPVSAVCYLDPPSFLSSAMDADTDMATSESGFEEQKQAET